MKTRTFFSNSAAFLLLLAGLLVIAGGCDFASITREHGEETTIYVPEDGPVVIERSAPPTAVHPVKEKTAPDQGEVTFALSAEHVGVWAVYDHATEESHPEGVGVNGAGATLTLYKDGGVPPGTYYITVTEEGKMESTRVALSVVDPGQSVAPRAERTTVLRNVDVDTVSFTLEGEAQSGTWAVYTRATGGLQPAGVSVSVEWPTLTLSRAGGGLRGTYYVAFTAPGKSESARLALTVNVGYRVTYDLNGVGGTPPAPEDVEAGGEVMLPAAPRLGFAFLGWWTEAGETQGEKAGDAGALYKPAGNLTLYANWDWVGYLNLTRPDLSRGSGFFYDGGVFHILDGAEVYVGGRTTTARIVAEGTATVTLDGAVIDLSGSSGCPFDLEEGANVTLRLMETNALTVRAGMRAAGIHVFEGRTLTITSAAGDGEDSGTLNVTGGEVYAGIGGGWGEHRGSITIAGGTVTAQGGVYGAGIGGGGGIGLYITISGGTVNAYGGDGGAGVGGGGWGGGCTIRISGGTVNARSFRNGAGIGGGHTGNGGNITITGGTVNAICNEGDGAGIGGGNGGAGVNITISGGTVDATALGSGAGIGGGAGSSGGTININKPPGPLGASTGKATGGSGAPGVGPGAGGTGGSFNGGAFPTDNSYEW